MIVVVCSVVVCRRDKFLLIQEEKEEAAGKYGLPGGKLEHGETLEEGARRELEEETGYRADNLSLISITHKPSTREGNSVVRFVYRADTVRCVDEAAELKSQWLTSKELEKLFEQGKIRGDDVLDLVHTDQDDLTIKVY